MGILPGTIGPPKVITKDVGRCGAQYHQVREVWRVVRCSSKI